MSDKNQGDIFEANSKNHDICHLKMSSYSCYFVIGNDNGNDTENDNGNGRNLPAKGNLTERRCTGGFLGWRFLEIAWKSSHWSICLYKSYKEKGLQMELLHDT